VTLASRLAGVAPQSMLHFVHSAFFSPPARSGIFSLCYCCLLRAAPLRPATQTRSKTGSSLINPQETNKMKNLFKMLMVALFAIGLSGAATAEEKRGTADEAVAMVKKAGAYLKKNGRAKAIEAFNKTSGEFIKGDLYVFMFATEGPDLGVTLAHGQNQKMVGKNILEINADGVYPIKEFIKLANSPAGKGWVVYKWPNSISKNLEEKHTYIEKFGDVLLGVGIYK
jgi:cytochrome c